jgi:hypothetical protein
MRDVGWDQRVDGIALAKRTGEEARVRGVADRWLCALVDERLQVVFRSCDNTNFLTLLEQRMRRKAPVFPLAPMIVIMSFSSRFVASRICSPPHRLQ